MYDIYAFLHFRRRFHSIKNEDVKSIVGITPTMVQLSPLRVHGEERFSDLQCMKKEKSRKPSPIL